MTDAPLSLSFNPAGIELDRRQGLSRQLYQALRVRVLDGRLASGTRLPASRDLAAALAISRNSVVRAYDQLYAEGFIEGRVGDGTYVAQLPQAPLPGRKAAPKVPPGVSAKGLEVPVVAADKVIHSGALARLENNHLPTPPSGPPRAFRVGVPAFDLFPFEVWAKLNAAFWRKPDLQQLCYGAPQGDARLRGMIAAYLRSSRGMQCTAEQIVVTSGAQQGISLCAQLLVEPGDGVAIENPGYRAAGHAFAVAGARLHGVAVDSEGIDCSELARLGDCRLAYVTPSHQYPTGVVMSLARRLELLAWAERSQGWIVEDDYDGEYRYSGAPLAPLAALDRQRAGALRRYVRQSRLSRRCAWVIWCLPPALVRGVCPTSGGGCPAFRGEHPGGDGRVHGRRAFSAPRAAHAPCRVEPPQHAIGRLARGYCGCRQPAERRRRVAHDGGGRHSGPRTRTDRGRGQRRCRDQWPEQLLATGFDKHAAINAPGWYWDLPRCRRRRSARHSND